MPTLDLQVAASTDDCQRRKYEDTFFLNYVEFLVGYYSSTMYKWGSGARFLNVAIPQGSTITTAYLTLRARSSNSNTVVKSRISAEKADNPATFSTKEDFDTRWANRTDARVDWDNIPAWTAGVDYNSPEIKTVIQEIVNRAGWVSGNALVIFWEDFEDRSTHSNARIREAYSYDGSTTYAPKLHIEYTPPGGPAGRSFTCIIG